MIVGKLIMESWRFAATELRSNLLRTTLSLLGVTVGIFAIITVFTLVDSLEKSIRNSFDFLGAGVVYVQKWPWMPEGNEQYKWWDYWNRPNPTINEYKFMQANMKNHSAIAIFAEQGNQLVKKDNNSVGEVILIGASYPYSDIFDLSITNGRYFSQIETEGGRNVAIIGDNLVQKLFPGGKDPIGKEIKLKNQKFIVIGTLEREGESFLGFESKDDNCIIPYNSFRKFFRTGTGAWNETGSSIGIKGKEEDIGMVQLENEVKGLLRSRRGLKPKDKDNFALNRPEALGNAISGVFDVLGIAGWVIGGFSILVGGFGILNIMFVSVKERTHIIGIQKSLGAKNYFILFQFLFEAIFLSLIGGLAGLVLVFLVTLIPLGELEVVMSLKNITLGVGVAVIVGTVSGIIPAAGAARMDPVIAIRSN